MKWMEWNVHCGWFILCELHIEIWINFFVCGEWTCNAHRMNRKKEQYRPNWMEIRACDHISRCCIYTIFHLFFRAHAFQCLDLLFCFWPIPKRSLFFTLCLSNWFCVHDFSYVIQKMWFIDYCYCYYKSYFIFRWLCECAKNLCECEYLSGFHSHRYHFWIHVN